MLSTFGVMFTPDQDTAAAELLRVCKSGGKIGLANWTPEGFIGQLFKTLGKYLPPPAGAKSPALWGTQARITEMFGASAASIKAERRHFTFRYRSPTHFLDVFRTYYGPMLKAFAALDETNQRRLADDILALIASMNRAEDGTMVRAERVSRDRDRQALTALKFWAATANTDRHRPIFIQQLAARHCLARVPARPPPRPGTGRWR